MEVTYQKTTQFNTDIISFKRDISRSILLIPSKKILILIAKLVKRVLFKKLDNVSKLLKENQDIFPNEYYDWIEINEMIQYTLKRDPSLIKQDDFNFVSDIHNSFFELMIYKLNLLKDNECEFNKNFYNKFNPKYDEFNNDLIKFKEYFYGIIYQESFDNQEVIDYLKISRK